MIKKEISILDIYENKYAKFNYVTPQENKSLSRHQRDDVFIDIETAYKEANIELVEMTSEEYKKRREGK
ncbi:hypothetical protein [Runella sp.]|jgi:hypothetical protein|uniref:hypothetical protein n=1 Tax=Runella sp. TaxID=1960881 RepID=UPI00262E76CA|nr:hypothetical protein [Runella sp.]